MHRKYFVQELVTMLRLQKPLVKGRTSFDIILNARAQKTIWSYALKSSHDMSKDEETRWQKKALEELMQSLAG